MMSVQHISAAIEDYAATFAQEAPVLADLRRLLAVSADATSRAEFRGHVTCSGALLSEAGAVTLIKHRTLGAWLLPGGHIEPSDASLRHAARRELCEELGLDEGDVRDLALNAADCPIDIDRHPIGANPAKQEPAHEHWDFRFLFRAAPGAVASVTAEIAGLRQAAPSEVSARFAGHLDRILAMELSWTR